MAADEVAAPDDDAALLLLAAAANDASIAKKSTCANRKVFILMLLFVCWFDADRRSSLLTCLVRRLFGLADEKIFRFATVFIIFQTPIRF